MRLAVSWPDSYRLTIEDLDPSWVEGRAADVHGMPAGTGHWWADRDGRYVEGYEPDVTCGGCGWRLDEDPIDSGLAAVRYEGFFGHAPPAKARA
jgi:hypothetical protein